MPRETTKVAVMGAGNWGAKIVAAVHAIGALGAIIEKSEKIRLGVKKQYPDVEVYEDWESLKKSSIKAIVMATPAPTHFSLGKVLLNQGFDLMVEKPMTLSYAEAKELAEVATKQSRLLMVGHLLLYQPAMRWLHDYLQKGTLGKIYSLHQERVNLGKVRAVENVLWSFGVHDIAVFLYLLGCGPEQVQMVSQDPLQPGIADDVYLHLQFPKGISAHLHTSWLWPERCRRMTIVAERGILQFDEILGKIVLHKKRIDAHLNNVDEGTEVIFEQSGDPLRIEMQHFLDCVASRSKPLSDASQGVEVIRILEMCSQLNASQQLRKAG